MKKRNIALIIAGAVIVAAGFAINEKADGDLPTGYIVILGSSSAPIPVKDGFKAALQKAQARKGIVFKPPQNDTPPDAGPWLSLSTDSTISIPPGSVNNPEGLNVTQKVRFNANQQEDLIDLLEEIDYGAH